MVRKINILLVALILVFAAAMPVSAANVPYQGTIGDNYRDYFKGVLSDVSIFDNYVFWRSGEYSYSMLVGDIEVSESGIFSLNGTGDLYVITQTFIDGSSQWQQNSFYTYQHFIDISNYEIDTSYGYLVFSDLDGYPSLEERGTLYSYATFFVLFVFSLCFVIYRLFKFCLRGRSDGLESTS